MGADPFTYLSIKLLYFNPMNCGLMKPNLTWHMIPEAGLQRHKKHIILLMNDSSEVIFLFIKMGLLSRMKI